ADGRSTRRHDLLRHRRIARPEPLTLSRVMSSTSHAAERDGGRRGTVAGLEAGSRDRDKRQRQRQNRSRNRNRGRSGNRGRNGGRNRGRGGWQVSSQTQRQGQEQEQRQRQEGWRRGNRGGSSRRDACQLGTRLGRRHSCRRGRTSPPPRR